MKRKSLAGGAGKGKKKAIVAWDRDVILLPKDNVKLGKIPYPRGKARARLWRDGLIGKVHLTSVMSVEDVEDEIRSTFASVLGSGSFTYLQATGGSTRCLSVPSVSTSFRWTAQQVAKLGNQRNTIYILADGDLNLPCSFDEVCPNLYTHDKALCTSTLFAYIVCIGYVR